MVGGWVRVHHHANICRIERLCGAMPSLSLDVSPLNLVSHLTLMPSFPAVSMDIRLLLLNKSLLKKKTNKQTNKTVEEYFPDMSWLRTTTLHVVLDSLTKWRAAGKIELSKRLFCCVFLQGNLNCCVSGMLDFISRSFSCVGYLGIILNEEEYEFPQ